MHASERCREIPASRVRKKPGEADDAVRQNRTGDFNAVQLPSRRLLQYATLPHLRTVTTTTTDSGKQGKQRDREREREPQIRRVSRRQYSALYKFIYLLTYLLRETERES